MENVDFAKNIKESKIIALPVTMPDASNYCPVNDVVLVSLLC